MLSTLSEKKLHLIRWVVFLAWCLLIASLFYDPVSPILSHPGNGWGWLADPMIKASQDTDQCVNVQDSCVLLASYSLGLRVFWGVVVPSAIFVVLVFGHEFWRRICPLYFFSQLPRALGMKPLLKIESNKWLQENHLELQFFLFFLGITARILLVNSVRTATGVFFIITLLSAAIVVALYGGRSWCHYVCPFGMVQTVFTGPRGLLDSSAHTAVPYSITQSMCRTVDGRGVEQSNCVSCKSACMDIDSEQAYWTQLYKPGRRLVQYGYLGLVIGYFAYYALYAGNFDYYFSGVWAQEAGTLDALVKPGFYVLGQAISIPKIIAAPLTLFSFTAASCWLCTQLESYYRGYLKSRNSEATAETSLHRMFSLCTFLAFNIFFIYGGRPEINRWPVAAQLGFQGIVAIVSSLWLYRTWGRSRERYEQESQTDRLRRQLKKMPMDIVEVLGSRTIEQLSAEELNILVKTLPQLASPTASEPNVATSVEGFAMPKTVIRDRRSKPVLSNTAIPKTRIRNRSEF